MTTITVCRTCRQDRDDQNPIRDGFRLLHRVAREVEGEAAGEEIELCAVRCLGACDRACAAQITSGGKFTYVLADLDPETAAPDLVAFARAHAEAENGLVPKPRRPEALKTKVIARVPPLDLRSDPIETSWEPLDPRESR
jgi:predicted metal-binding protein